MTASNIPVTPGERWAWLPGLGEIRRHCLCNAQGMRLEICNLGASLLSWQVPDRHGRMDEVLLGHGDPLAYAQGRGYLGAIVGRWANRIRRGRFELDGVHYQVECNEGLHHLHGGSQGLHQALWQVETEGSGLRLSLEWPASRDGFPGDLQLQLRCALDDEGVLSLDYLAHCNQPTPINLTAHPYFNLGGPHGDIHDHVLQIHAGHYLAVDAGMIPVRRDSVAGTAFDFRQPAPLGSRMDWPDDQLKLAGGFDHCFCLEAAAGRLRQVASAFHPASGRRLTVSTDQNGLQLYTGQHLACAPDRAGGMHRPFAGLCLEAQAFPDQINSTLAEHCVLRPGQFYRQRTRYRIDTI